MPDVALISQFVDSLVGSPDPGAESSTSGDVERLADEIYEVLHQRRRPSSNAQSVPFDTAAELDDCFRTARSWWPDWSIGSVQASGAAMLTRSGLVLRAGSDHWRIRTPVTADVSIPARLRGLIPGWYTIGGDSLPGADHPRWRLYFNCRAPLVVTLIRLLREETAARAVPMITKVARDIGAVARTDSVVVEFEEHHADLMEHEVCARIVDVFGAFRPETSAFVKCVRPGVGLARSTNDGMLSFGRRASTALAEAVVDVANGTPRTVGWREVKERLLERGVDIEQIHCCDVLARESSSPHR